MPCNAYLSVEFVRVFIRSVHIAHARNSFYDSIFETSIFHVCIWIVKMTSIRLI